MSNHPENSSKHSSDRMCKHSKTSSAIYGKIFSKITIPKKVIASKKISRSFHEEKSSSAAVINKTEKAITRPKKTTKSEATFSKKDRFTCNDYCKKCGDYGDENSNTKRGQVENYSDYDIPTIINSINSKVAKNDRKKSIQQYYRNEKFNASTNSIVENGVNDKKNPLDTIKEDSEAKSKASETIYKIYTGSDSESEDNFDKEENVRQIKEFRQNNYFECHSTKSRLNSKTKSGSSSNHRCVYRLYLNERLFPVPLNADYKGTIRCVECHLPMEDKTGDLDEKINGTIQAKVKLGDELQDMTLLLPIKEPLIIKERRKEEKYVRDVVYFGVIKLDTVGDSMFNRVTPGDSLALKYQKGYKEFAGREMCRYNRVEDNDVIII